MIMAVEKTLEEQIVDGQLEAYNKRDYETFTRFYDQDIKSFDLESGQVNPEMSGANFFAHYKGKFQENPNIHCEVTMRIQHGNLVVDKEIISDYQSGNHSEMVIYQIEQEKITKMWFSKEISLKELSEK